MHRGAEPSPPTVFNIAVYDINANTGRAILDDRHHRDSRLEFRLKYSRSAWLATVDASYSTIDPTVVFSFDRKTLEISFQPGLPLSMLVTLL